MQLRSGEQKILDLVSEQLCATVAEDGLERPKEGRVKRHHAWRRTRERDVLSWQLEDGQFVLAERHFDVANLAIISEDPAVRWPKGVPWQVFYGPGSLGTIELDDEWRWYDLASNPVPFMVRAALR